MSTYMYNVLFDFNKKDGLFSGDDNSTPSIPKPLRSSRNWLVWDTPAAPDPEGNNWRDLGQADTLLVRKDDVIWIRVAPTPASQQNPAALALDMAVSFGKPAPFGQKQASPFTHNNSQAGNKLTTFFGATPTTRGWKREIGQIAVCPGDPSKARVHRYQFSLGIIVTDPATNEIRHYGEDPEMDVGD